MLNQFELERQGILQSSQCIHGGLNCPIASRVTACKSDAAVLLAMYVVVAVLGTALAACASFAAYQWVKGGSSIWRTVSAMVPWCFAAAKLSSSAAITVQTCIPACLHVGESSHAGLRPFTTAQHWVKQDTCLLAGFATRRFWRYHTACDRHPEQHTAVGAAAPTCDGRVNQSSSQRDTRVGDPLHKSKRSCPMYVCSSISSECHIYNHSICPADVVQHGQMQRSVRLDRPCRHSRASAYNPYCA